MNIRITLIGKYYPIEVGWERLLELSVPDDPLVTPDQATADLLDGMALVSGVDRVFTTTKPTKDVWHLIEVLP